MDKKNFWERIFKRKGNLKTDRDAVLDDHGIEFGRKNYSEIGNPSESHTPETDRDSALRDLRLGNGVPDSGIPTIPVDTGYEIGERDVIDHGGLPLGVKSDGKEFYGTDEAKLQEIYKILLNSNKIENVNEIVSMLPGEAIIKLIEERYRKSANILDDKYGREYPSNKEALSINISLDATIIEAAIRNNPDIINSQFTNSTEIGENNTIDLTTFLSDYSKRIKETGLSLPLRNSDNNIISENITVDKKLDNLRDIIMQVKQENLEDINHTK